MKKRDYPIIDAHAHIFPDKIAEKSRQFVSEYYDLPMYTKGTISELLAVRKSTYSLPEKLKNLLRQVPDLVITAGYMGGYTHWEEAYLLPAVPNLYFDCSSTLAFIKSDYMLRMIDRFGVSQFFFGTDFSMWQPEEEIERLEDLRLGDEIEKAILHDNFERFIGGLED